MYKNAGNSIFEIEKKNQKVRKFEFAQMSKKCGKNSNWNWQIQKVRKFEIAQMSKKCGKIKLKLTDIQKCGNLKLQKSQKSAGKIKIAQFWKVREIQIQQIS